MFGINKEPPPDLDYGNLTKTYKKFSFIKSVYSSIITFIIPHILITINRLLWLDNGQKSDHVITQENTGNHIPWNKNHIPPPRKPRWFSRQSYRSLIGKRQKHSERIICYNVVVNVVFKCLRQRSNGLKICLSAVFYMYVFSWFHSV